jgi:dTDP-4-amino-4,6-dideoxygalactose transaminase
MSSRHRYVQAKPFLYEKDISAVNEVMQSLHLEEGEVVKAFEEKISEYYSKKFTAATINGFSSIHLALISMNVTMGDEVIIPAYTCPALLYPVKLTGAKVVYADIAENSFNLSLESIQQVFSKKTKCIIWPHMFGFPANMDKAGEIKKRIIEDVAQAMGGSIKGKTLGSLTDISVSSFYATKNITAGDGGAVSMNSKKLFDKVTKYRYYGGKVLLKAGQYYNYKMTNLNAGLGLSQLKSIEKLISERKKIANWYDERLNRYSSILYISFNNKKDACYHKYPVLFPTQKIRNVFRDELKKLGVHCGYGVLEGLHKIKDSGYFQSLKNTEIYLKRILCLPIYPGLSQNDVDIIFERFDRVYKKIF